MFCKPKWHESLPYHLKPSDDKIKRLEALRVELNLSHDLFMAGIGTSRWAVIKTQEATYENLKKRMPNATNKELWRGVLCSRYEVKLKIPDTLDPPANAILQKMRNLDKTMLHINSFQELIDYILSMEPPSVIDPKSLIQREIDNALFE